MDRRQGIPRQPMPFAVKGSKLVNYFLSYLLLSAVRHYSLFLLPYGMNSHHQWAPALSVCPFQSTSAEKQRTNLSSNAYH